MSTIPVSATLAANEILIRKRQAGEPSKMFRASFAELEADLAQLRRYRNKPE